LEILVKTMAGLETVLAAELKALGAKQVQAQVRAVRAQGDPRLLYRANYELRTALRVLLPIAQFPANNENELYRRVRDINWSRYLGANDTLAIDAGTQSTTLRHSHYLAQKCKDAIVDQFRARYGNRPSVDLSHPTLRLNLHLSARNLCTISLDSSSDSLHKRGYRAEHRQAPVNEVLAAGMVLLSGWKGERPFVDPMCGAGTIPIEAAMLAWNIPPQWRRRHFGFMRWPDFDRQLWRRVKEEAHARIAADGPGIFAFDGDPEAIKDTLRNLDNAGLEGKVLARACVWENLSPPPAPAMLIVNPPYDERLALDDAKAFYRNIGERLKHHFTGYEAWILSANKEAIKSVGLRPSVKKTLFNGPLECKFLKYELFAGKREDQAKPG
jgi:putative N6-adenine-specific DNA methylase